MRFRFALVLCTALVGIGGCGRAAPKSRRDGGDGGGKVTTGVSRPDPLVPLDEAAAYADEVELERAALRIPREVLVGALEDPRRRVRLAAVDALSLGDQPWATLGTLLERLEDADRETASRAAAGVLRVTSVHDERALIRADVTKEDLDAIAKRATDLAVDRRLGADVRAAAAVVAARLQAHVRSDPGPLVEAVGDDDPVVRYACLEALRAWRRRLGPHREALHETLQTTRDPRTSLLAAAALCASGRLDRPDAARTRELLSKGHASERALLAPCLGQGEEEPSRPSKKGRGGKGGRRGKREAKDG